MVADPVNPSSLAAPFHSTRLGYMFPLRKLFPWPFQSSTPSSLGFDPLSLMLCLISLVIFVHDCLVLGSHLRSFRWPDIARANMFPREAGPKHELLSALPATADTLFVKRLFWSSPDPSFPPNFAKADRSLIRPNDPFPVFNRPILILKSPAEAGLLLGISKPGLN